MTTGMLEGKHVLVTGAAGGIGAAIAEAVAEQGAAKVVLTDRRRDDMETAAAAVRSHGAEAFTLEADLASEAAIATLVDGAVAGTGGIDVLISSAAAHEKAMTLESGTADLTVERWDLVMAVNLRAPWLLTKLLAPSMAARGGGAVVNIASQHGIVAAERSPAYNSSKAGLIHLTRSAALDLADLGIRCNAVAPGVVDTPMVDQIFSLTDDPEAARAGALDTYMLRRFGAPADIAAAACFLASDLSSWTTGACLVVDGGQTAWR